MKILLTSLVVLAMVLGISFSTASASAGGFHHPESRDKNSILRKDTHGVGVRNMQYILNVMGFLYGLRRMEMKHMEQAETWDSELNGSTTFLPIHRALKLIFKECGYIKRPIPIVCKLGYRKEQ